MTRRKLLAALDVGQVEAAIGRAEAACAIELRVSVAGLFWGDADAMARRAFARLGMAATRDRNGVLVFLAPWRRKVIVLADDGITAKIAADAALWSGAVATITRAFAAARFTEGLVAALDDLARGLAPAFPPSSRANELPDRIDRGR
jgi:uncharacterized membrane protein